MKTINSYQAVQYLRDTKVRIVLLALFGSIFLVFFRSVMVSLFLAVILLLIGTISQAYKLFIPVNTGFELITFVSILFMFTYNPILGLMAAFIMTLTSSFFITKKVGVGLLFKLMAYSMMSLVAFIAAPLGIAAGGMLLVIVYNIFLRGVLFMGGANKAIALYSLAVNLALNYYLLSAFGSTLAGLL